MSKRSSIKDPSSQLSRKSSIDMYLFQYPIFMHDYSVKADGNYDFRAIGDLLVMGEESWSLVHIQLNGDVFLQ